MKLRLLTDIAADMQVCRLEGWDCQEYVRDLHNELTRLVERIKNGNAIKNELTKTQLETLAKCARGEVTFHRGIRHDSISGARKDTVNRLLANGLIGYPEPAIGYIGFAYILTDAGRAALESVRKKEGKYDL